MSRVLLVEDDPGVAEAMALALVSLGHAIRMAADGPAGLTEDLLTISQMDAGRAVVVLDHIDVVDLAREVISDLVLAGSMSTSQPTLTLAADRTTFVLRLQPNTGAEPKGRPRIDKDLGR